MRSRRGEWGKTGQMSPGLEYSPFVRDHAGMRIRHVLMGLMLSGVFLVACVTRAAESSEAPVLWSLNVGDVSDDEVLGFGWSRAEHVGGHRFRWITHLEGDVWAELSAPTDLTFTFTAMIPHLDWRRQRIGLFVNNRFVTDWQAPDDHHFHTYETDIPSAFMKEGRNRITLRMAYKTRIGQDSRRLSLAVDMMELRPR